MSIDDPRLSEIEDDQRQQVLDYIKGRWAQFASATRDARKDAATFIATINAGGAVALLGFIGSVVRDTPELAKAIPIRLALLAFVVGIACCGLAHAVENLRLSGLFSKWRDAVNRFYRDQIGFTRMMGDDVSRADEHDVANFLIWFALALFGIGAGLGLLALFGGD